MEEFTYLQLHNFMVPWCFHWTNLLLHKYILCFCLILEAMWINVVNWGVRASHLCHSILIAYLEYDSFVPLTPQYLQLSPRYICLFKFHLYILQDSTKSIIPTLKKQSIVPTNKNKTPKYMEIWPKNVMDALYPWVVGAMMNSILDVIKSECLHHIWE